MVVVIASSSACAHDAEMEEVALAARTRPSTATALNPPSGSTCTDDSACGLRQLCLQARCVEVSADLAACRHVHVQFAAGSSTLSQEDQRLLKRSARCLRADLAPRVTIEAPEADDNNKDADLAIGDLRATAVARFFVELGVPDLELRMLRFVQERSLCPEHDEICWTKHRRARPSCEPPSDQRKEARP
jgi:outer membrane protein OmpA-like peptidoglycan-associated protein